MKLIRLI